MWSELQSIPQSTSLPHYLCKGTTRRGFSNGVSYPQLLFAAVRYWKTTVAIIVSLSFIMFQEEEKKIY